MLTFFELSQDNLCALGEPLAGEASHFCDLTLGNVYMWRNELHTYFARHGDTLIVRKETQPGLFSYLFPLGKDIEGALEEIDEYAFAHHEKLTFYALNEEQSSFLKSRYPHHQSWSLRSWSDYLYNLSDLRDFPGKRYDSKRHNANRFHKQNPEVVLKAATEEDTPRLLSFVEDYLKENVDRDISFEEISLTREMLSHPKCIHADIGYYEKDGKIIGFALGERKGDTVYDHIEKALRSYEGIYQALTSDFLKMFGGDCLFVNREEDDGNEGLREAKLQLKPVAILEKFFFEVTNQIDLVKSFPALKDDKVGVRPLEEKDAADYAELALDDENNRFWGYDYRSDLPAGQKADSSYFCQDVQKDLAEKRGVSFAIVDGQNNLVGEVILYHFTSLGGAEIGIRLKKGAQGKGYAQKAFALIFAYCQNELALSSLLYECYRDNLPSQKLIAHFPFRVFHQDRERIYYQWASLADAR